MNLIRLITAGSVDDGKSTLIGRLLYDSKSILQDHLEVLEKQSKNRDEGGIDLALLTDGLRAEREQGITIDVAYKYFSTPKRKFIIADAPGHLQYTRNMVTGASTASVMVVLVDARSGVIEQARRHSIIASFLRIPHVILAVNKMDLMGFDPQVFVNISEEYSRIAATLGLPKPMCIPISALQGDNVVDSSSSMSWYKGPTLLEYLEQVPEDEDHKDGPTRFAVQYVIRPQTEALPDYRGYAGKMVSGRLAPGMRVMSAPAGIPVTIRSVSNAGVMADEVIAPMSVTIETEEDVDISRGDMLTDQIATPRITADIEAMVCWMDSKPLRTGDKYLLQHHGRRVRCAVSEIEYVVDVNTLELQKDIAEISLNAVARIKLRTQAPLAYDPFRVNRSNGGAILIDETSCVTVGALLLD